MLKNLLKVAGIGTGIIALVELGGIVGEAQMATALEADGESLSPEEFFCDINDKTKEVLKGHPYKRFKLKTIEKMYRILLEAYWGY